MHRQVPLATCPSGIPSDLLLLLLSHFSRVQLCATPQTAAHQAPPPLGFSRQEHWSGLPFPSPARESEAAQSCPTLTDPMDCSLPGSSVHRIFQARVLEWGAIAFSFRLARTLQSSSVQVSDHGGYVVRREAQGQACDAGRASLRGMCKLQRLWSGPLLA